MISREPAPIATPVKATRPRNSHSLVTTFWDKALQRAISSALITTEPICCRPIRSLLEMPAYLFPVVCRPCRALTRFLSAASMASFSPVAPAAGARVWGSARAIKEQTEATRRPRRRSQGPRVCSVRVWSLWACSADALESYNSSQPDSLLLCKIRGCRPRISFCSARLPLGGTYSAATSARPVPSNMVL